MDTNKSFKTNNFDLLRLLAAVEVVFDHYFQHLQIPLSKLQTNILYLFPGVPVFFIISGYLISASYERNSNLKTYFRNRALRIYPGLAGCILATIVIISLTGINFFNKETIAWIPLQLVGLIYTPQFLSNYGFGSYNGSLWTIPIELQFYIALPILYYIIPKKHFTNVLFVLFGLFVLVNIAYLFIPLNPTVAKLVAYTFAPHFYLFLLGVILQRKQVFNKKLVSGKGLVWLCLYGAFCFGCYTWLNPLAFEIIRNLLLGFVVLSLAYSWPNVAEKLLRGHDLSYGIYIYHGLILTVLINQGWALKVGLVGLLLLTLIMATLSWLLVERPFIKRKKQTIRQVA